jgi:hypothetical protein
MCVTFPLDHILPKSHGGLPALDNLAFACPWCNGFKRDAMSDWDGRSRRRARLFNPRTDVWRAHFRWSSDRLRILGKTAIGRATVRRLRMNAREAQLVRSFLIAIHFHPAEDPDCEQRS